MAEVTVGTIQHEAAINPNLGDKHLRIPVTVTTTGDTLATTTSGHPGAVTRVAWEAVNTTDPMAVTFAASTMLITFTTGTGGSTGFLHTWGPA